MKKARKELIRREKKRQILQGEILRGCYHEAGHCVVAHRLNVPVLSMELLVKDGLGGKLAFFVGKSNLAGLDEGMGDPEKRDETIKKIISIKMAGPICRAIVFGWDEFGRGDQDDLDSLYPIIVSIPDIGKRPDAIEAECQFTQRTIQENLPAVKRLAFALADRLNKGENPGRLEEKEILKILEGERGNNTLSIP